MTNGISQCGTLRDTRVFPILELEFTEFMESDQSLKYELGQSKDSLLGCKNTELPSVRKRQRQGRSMVTLP